LLGFAKPFLLTLVPVVLILLEPDLGTSLLFMPTLLALLWTSGSRKRHLAAVFVAAVVAVPASYPMLKPHQKARVDALIAQIEGDRRYEQDIGYQSARAMDLVGAGGVEGRGEEAAVLIRHNHLPESHNDMVFAVIACRWGLWGGVAVLGLIAAAVIGAFGAAWVSRDAYGRLLAVGIATMLAGQAVVNIAMTIGLAPVTGMTLPFVSFGGSSLVVTWAMVGLVLNVALRRPPSLAPRRIFEFAAEDER
ncbi:MAG: FtsW/RodA/SpoVE family cell cycle protein, partial [Phycisphaerales bacterium]